LPNRVPGYDPGDSDFESRVLRVIVANGFPPPAQQYRVRIGGRTIRIDLAYPDRKLAIELDGCEFHHTRSAFDDDRSRANLLVAHGWTLIRFTSGRVTRRSSTSSERLFTSGRHSAPK
jgi:very-short-patch-repair endonuclease